jgi:hypothetical protein
VAEHGRGSTAQCEPGSRDLGIDTDERQVEQRDDARPDRALADVDEHDAECEGCPLRPQRISPARIAAAHGTNVNAASDTADDHGPHNGPQEVTEQEFDAEFEHHT